MLLLKTPRNVGLRNPLKGCIVEEAACWWGGFHFGIGLHWASRKIRTITGHPSTRTLCIETCWKFNFIFSFCISLLFSLVASVAITFRSMFWSWLSSRFEKMSIKCGLETYYANHLKKESIVNTGSGPHHALVQILSLSYTLTIWETVTYHNLVSPLNIIHNFEINIQWGSMPHYIHPFLDKAAHKMIHFVQLA